MDASINIVFRGTEVHQVCAFGFVYRSRGDISANSRLLGLGALWKTCKLPRIDAWAVADALITFGDVYDFDAFHVVRATLTSGMGGVRLGCGVC